jgi:hypothetical protein
MAPCPRRPNRFVERAFAEQTVHSKVEFGRPNSFQESIDKVSERWNELKDAGAQEALVHGFGKQGRQTPLLLSHWCQSLLAETVLC